MSEVIYILGIQYFGEKIYEKFHQNWYCYGCDEFKYKIYNGIYVLEQLSYLLFWVVICNVLESEDISLTELS